MKRLDEALQTGIGDLDNGRFTEISSDEEHEAFFDGMRSYRFSEAAEADLERILAHSLNAFGEAAALRYANLLKVSVDALREETQPPGVTSTIRGLSHFHTALCKKEAQIDDIVVASPRHIIFFRISDEILEIVRILHESMDFERHI